LNSYDEVSFIIAES